jgi:dTDP-4-dehydrorhamnose reductase
LDADENDAVGKNAGSRPVIVLGAAGQLGETIVARFGSSMPMIAVTRSALDLTNAADVRRYMTERRPRAIVNCAGFNQVDLAEDEPETAMEANAFAVQTLARAAEDIDAVLVQFSSDFVFDGNTDRPYHEGDRPGPMSVYAASKLLGEWFAADARAHYILRVESLFGGVSRLKSSLDRIIEAIAAGKHVRVFVDRIVSPSYAWDVANATQQLLTLRPPSGVYHCVNTGAATWQQVAEEIRRQLNSNALLEPVSVADVALPAARPRYCALSNIKLREAGIVMPTWQDAVERCLAERPTTNKHQEQESHRATEPQRNRI